MPLCCHGVLERLQDAQSIQKLQPPQQQQAIQTPEECGVLQDNMALRGCPQHCKQRMDLDPFSQMGESTMDSDGRKGGI